MAIKKVRFVLAKSSYQYTAFGGVRFYKSETEVINSGTQVSASPTSGETQNFLANSDAGFSGTNYYHLPYIFDTNKKQNGTYTDFCYWLTDSSNAIYTITVEFKAPISALNKIEFVARPDGAFLNRGIDKPFAVEILDENNNSIGQYSVTPTTQVNTVQTFILPYKNKILLSSGDKYSLKDSIVFKMETDSEKNFLNYGADTISNFNGYAVKKKDIKSTSVSLGSGKTFEHIIDMSIRRVDKIILT